MPSEYILDIGAKVTPEDKGGPRVGIGGKVTVKRDSFGSVGVQILRGDGGFVESFNVNVRSLTFGPVAASELLEIEIGCLDLPAFQTNGDPRTYRMRLLADGGAELAIIQNSAIVAPEPYAPAGFA